MVSTNSLGIMADIIRFCRTTKDKDKIVTRLSLNDVQTASYLAILTRQRLISHNDGDYVVTETGQSYLSSYDRFRKIRF